MIRLINLTLRMMTGLIGLISGNCFLKDLFLRDENDDNSPWRKMQYYLVQTGYIVWYPVVFSSKKINPCGTIKAAAEKGLKLFTKNYHTAADCWNCLFGEGSKIEALSSNRWFNFLKAATSRNRNSLLKHRIIHGFYKSSQLNTKFN